MVSAKPILLIDGDILAYAAASSCETEIRWDENLHTLHSDPTEAIAKVEDKIAALRERLGARDHIIALSDGRSFRYDVLSSYKHNRKDVRKPLALQAVKQHLLDEHKTYLRPRLEGDDILGILMTNHKIVPGPKIQVSIDKDQRQIPGQYYNPNRDELVEITAHEADRWHMMQTLMGDTTDGYSGCPGVGKVGAAKILDAAVEDGTPWANPQQLVGLYWQHVLKAFAKAGHNEEFALQQARVARILRASDYDFKKKEPILWTPPK